MGRIKFLQVIKVEPRKTSIHYEGPDGTETLCGIPVNGDDNHTSAMCVDDAVDCEDCMAVISHVQDIVADHMRNIPFNI